MRNAGRLKLGYYPLPVEEARNIRALLVSSAPYAAIDPCVGDGTALIEITRNTGAHRPALSSTRTEQPRPPRMASRQSTAVLLSAGSWRKPARFCI